jgi:hypothetical protein
VKHYEAKPAALRGGAPYLGNQQYRGNGRMRSCNKCLQHRPAESGTHVKLRGRAQWVSTLCCAPVPAAAETAS